MTYLRIMPCIFASLLLLLSSCRNREDLSQSVKDFEESNQAKGHMSLYFYPSTIRMLNYGNDSSFNALVKDIKKLKILTFNHDKDSITPEQVNTLRNHIRKESFVDLMQFKQNNQQVMIFLKKENNKPKEFLGMVYSEKNLTIVDLLGSIPISSLPALINGKINLSGFMSVVNNPKSSKQSKQKNGKRSSNN
jgi:hypothetical protein